MMDYYDILRVPPGASEETIQQRYEFLLDNLRGDGFSRGEADQNFARAKEEIRLLNEAYEVLHDSGSRRRYDRERNVEIGFSREVPCPALEEPPAPQWTMPQPEPATPTRTRPRRWHDPWDAKILAAFAAGLLMASGVLAAKYWRTGLHGQNSFVARLLIREQQQGELAVRQPANAALAVIAPAGPARPARGQSSRIVDPGAVRVKSGRRPQASDAAEGQIGAVRNERPVSVDITLAKGQQSFGSQQIGNVEVYYPNGIQDCWTTKGNCGQPHVAANGTVGWTVYQPTKSGNYDFQPNGTLVFRRGGQIIQTINVAGEYIDGWNFLDTGNKVAVRSRGAPGGTVLERYDTATGRLLDSVDASRVNLPSWALSVAF